MVDKERVQVRVSDERKREWLEAVNSSTEYNNLSHLIIRSVERELSDSGDSGGEVDVGEVNVDLSPVMDELRDMRDDISNVKRQIQQVEASAADSSEIIELAQEIMRMIPDSETFEASSKRTSVNAGSQDDDIYIYNTEEVEERIGYLGNEKDIVEYFSREMDYDKNVVKLAISKLETDMSRVERRDGCLVREV